MAKNTAANAPKLPESWEGATEITHGGFWKDREVGETLRGILIGIRDSQGKYKEPVADFQQESGEIISVGMSAVLRSRISRALIGRDIGLQYLGKSASAKEGAEDFHDFRVVVFGGDTDENLPF